MSHSARVDKERIALYAALAVTGTIAAGAVYYAAKNVYDNYVPYQASDRHASRHAPAPRCPCASSPTTPAPSSQYHYRPGTLTGWLAGALNSYAKKRRSEWLPRPDWSAWRHISCTRVTPPPAPPHPHRPPPRARVHGRLLRHDALWALQRPAPGEAGPATPGAAGPAPATHQRKGGQLAVSPPPWATPTLKDSDVSCSQS